MLLPRQLVERCARNFPSKAAFLCGDRRATWREMDERSSRFASWLVRSGYGSGTAVAILSQESIEVYEHFFACMKAGSIRVGLNTLYAWPELEHVLFDSATKLVLVDARCIALIEPHRAELEAKGITFVGYNGAHGLAHDYEAILREEDGHATWPALTGDDLCLYSYTSGTTGVPKGVMLTHEGVSSVVTHTVIAFGFSPDEVWYMPAASSWAVVLMNLFGLANGMTSVLPDGVFQITNVLQDIERLRVTSILLVPTMIRRAITEQQARRFDLSSLRTLVYGSAPATPQLIRDARAEFGVKMLQTYGSTETTGGWLTVLTEEDHRRGLDDKPELLRSVGRVGIPFECTIRDENGTLLPPNTRGELWIKSRMVMKGYLNLPEATASVLRDGWLRSNDIGKMDEDGYLYLLDRQNFMIITGAVNVFPSTVEAIIGTHPALQEAAVVGVLHPEWGEAVVAVVVLRPGHASVSTAELSEFCKGKLSRAETPKHVIVVSELPKTLNGKIKKGEIRDSLVRTVGAVPWDTNVR